MAHLPYVIALLAFCVCLLLSMIATPAQPQLDPPKLRLVFLSLEFSTATFSGNGVYAQSQVRALAALGHDVLVISAVPRNAAVKGSSQGAVQQVEVPVSSWGRLDLGSPWQEYANGVLAPHILHAVRDFAPQAVLGVDWSSLEPFKALTSALPGVPYVFLNYRVFSRTAAGDDLAALMRMESEALQTASLTIALSRSDAHFLHTRVAAGRHNDKAAPPLVLLPALRDDVRVLALAADGSTSSSIPDSPAEKAAHAHPGASTSRADTPEQCPLPAAGSSAVGSLSASRPYLTCCVRLSEEKEPHRFIELVTYLAQHGLLEKLHLTPLLVGAGNDSYAQGLRDALARVAPGSVILSHFMGPAELAEVYRKTRINFHPPMYDAYGMTIVEAASQGAPSVVHAGAGAVGATELLLHSEAQIFEVDYRGAQGIAAIASALERLALDAAELARVSQAARAKALSWHERANAQQLVEHIHAHVLRELESKAMT